MSKKILFYLLLFGTLPVLQAQGDDYVIAQPKEPLKAKFEQLENPDYTNYLLSASSFTLKERDIRVTNTDIFFAKGSYGLTDNTTASASISAIGTLVGSIKQQVHISDEFKLGFSAALGQIVFISKDSVIYFGGGQTMVTLGDYQNNLTVGFGLYYAKSSFEFIDGVENFLLNNFYFAGQKQLGRRVYIIAEGIYFNNYNILAGTLGFKVIIKESITLGAGLMSLAWVDPSISITTSATNNSFLPLLTFRKLINRH